MGVASYRRGSALISQDFARDAYAKGWSSHDPDAVQAAAKPRPLDWGSKSDEKALDHARRMVSGSRKYGREVDAEVLALAVADKAKVSLDRATRAVQIVLAGPDGATKMNPRRRNPDTLRTIVLANLDPVGDTEWYQDGWARKSRPIPLVQALSWVNAGDAEDERKARAFAKKEGYEVFIFPTSEADPLGKAKRELLSTWKAAAVEIAKEAARAKAAKSKRRKVVNPKLRCNSADRYEKVKALAERGSTEHERATAARILAGLRSPAQEARAALDAARAKEAQQVAAAYEVLHELRPGDKVEVVFEPKSSSSPNDKRTVTVTSVQDLGKDQHRHAYTTSGRVMPGIPAGGAIMDYGGGDLYFQATMRTPIKRVISLRVVGVAPKGAALLGAKANPGKRQNPNSKASVRTKPVRLKGVSARGWQAKKAAVDASVRVITEGRSTAAGERGGLGGFTDINAARRYIAYRPGGDITPAVLSYRAKHAAERGYFSKAVLEKALEAEEISRGYVTSW